MPSSSSSIYSYRPGGSLKFKGDNNLPAKKKKKSKSKSSTSKDLRTKDDYRSSSKDRGADSSIRHEEEDDAAEEQQSTGKVMTEAEKKFEEIKRKRMADRVAKEAGLSHKDRVDKFNKSLAERTEHNDMLTIAGH